MKLTCGTCENPFPVQKKTTVQLYTVLSTLYTCTQCCTACAVCTDCLIASHMSREEIDWVRGQDFRSQSRNQFFSNTAYIHTYRMTESHMEACCALLKNGVRERNRGEIMHIVAASYASQPSGNYSPMYVFTKHNYKPKEMCDDKSVSLGPSPTLKAWFRPKQNTKFPFNTNHENFSSKFQSTQENESWFIFLV